MESAQHRHRVNLIERPPFYHLPRSRPISFEEPTHLTCENNCATIRSRIGPNSIQQQHHQHQQGATANMCSSATSRSSNFASYNSSPKPFSRQETCDDWQRGSSSSIPASGGCQCSLKSQQVPTILVNNQSYPTSTVHKSLFNSLKQATASDSCKSRQQNNQHQHVHYSRLISPTHSTTSCECPVIGESHQQQRSNLSHGERLILNDDRQREDCTTANRTASDNAIGVDERGNRNFSHRREDLTGGQVMLPRRESIHTPLFVGLSQQPLRYERERDSNVVKPDSKRDEFMFTRQLERASIAHQTYRTLPIVQPKPKARHDLATGTYMSLTQDPTWELTHLRPSSANSSNNRGNNHERKIQQALNQVNQVVGQVSWPTSSHISLS